MNPTTFLAKITILQLIFGFVPSEFRNYCTEDVCCVDKYVYLTNVKSLLRCFLFAVPGFGFHFSSCRALDTIRGRLWHV